MFNGLINFIRNMDPANDITIGWFEYVNDFSTMHYLAELPGPLDGEYEISDSQGLAVLGAYKRRADAEDHLARAKLNSRSFRRIAQYNGWRLANWMISIANAWRDSMRTDLDEVIA